MERRSEAARIGGLKLKSPVFYCMSSLIMFYRLVYDYIKVCEHMNLGGQGSLFLIDFLRFFNKISKQLVLEGGASAYTQKGVGVKHIALCAQSLCFIVEEMPYIQARLDSVSAVYHGLLEAVTD